MATATKLIQGIKIPQDKHVILCSGFAKSNTKFTIQCNVFLLKRLSLLYLFSQ